MIENRDANQDSPEQGPQQWQNEVDAILARSHPLPKGRDPILFYGSSTIRLWPSSHFLDSDYDIFYHGIGGAPLCDLWHYHQDLVVDFHPRHLFFYGGGNDIAKRRTAQDIFDDMMYLFLGLQEKCPGLCIYPIGLMAHPRFHKFFPVMEEFNQMVKKECAARDDFHFIDFEAARLALPLADQAACFGEDQIHLSTNGYALWQRVMQDVVSSLRA